MTVAKRKPFPLQWPEGWKRATTRYGKGTGYNQAKFEAVFTRDRDSVIRQLKMRGSQVVITSDLPTRSDGLPYASSTCNDPGIAVYWVEKGRERVIACDRWRKIDLNLRAIEMSIEAMRGLDRWGASEMVERAFAGFAALPAAGGTSVESPEVAAVVIRSWQGVFEVQPLVDILSPVDLLAVVRARHRDMIKKHHPDLGGDAEIAIELNAALAAAEQELGI